MRQRREPRFSIGFTRRVPVNSPGVVQPNNLPRSPFSDITATLVRVSDPPAGAEFNEAEEIAYLHAAPVETILGNHLFVLLQVAALRLAETPPNLAAAELVIDTVRAMVNAGGDRLGEHVDLYRNALAEVQQAYVRTKSSSSGS